MSLRLLRRSAGETLLVGFAGLAVPPEVRSLAREFGLGGVVLFARNVEAPEQVAELAFEVRQLVRHQPPWVAVDQEGGRVARLRTPFTEWPPMAVLGRTDPAEGDALAGRFAQALAAELRAVGVSLDLAPVLDVHTNPANPVIGDRALSASAARVAALGRIIIDGLQRAGVAACGKHFPGHGDTSVDSHHELPCVEHEPRRLREVEWVPFRAAIEADVAAIMTAHLLVPALDEERPATLSRRIVEGVLRDQLHHDGLVLTDDLEMKAIAGRYAIEEAAVEALSAGCDGLLICGTDHDVQARAIEAVIRAVEQDRLPLARVEAALARHRRAKERFLAGDLPARPPSARALREVIGCDAHQRVADDMRRLA